MLGVNIFKQDSDRLRLEILSSRLLAFIWLVGLASFLVGLFLFVQAIFQTKDNLFSELASASSGLALLVFARTLFVLQGLLKNLLVHYEFDLKGRVFRIEGGGKVYPHIPRVIPFAELKMLRMLVLPADVGGMPHYYLELVLENGRFYPLTAFKSETRARNIIREIQQALILPVDEQRIEKQGFREYKHKFLSQFQPVPIREYENQATMESYE